MKGVVCVVCVYMRVWKIGAFGIKQDKAEVTVVFVIKTDIRPT